MAGVRLVAFSRHEGAAGGVSIRQLRRSLPIFAGYPCPVAVPALVFLMPKPLPTRLDLPALFAQYEALTREANALFAHVRAEHADCVACKAGCSGCCHMPFELTLIEAVYLKQAFLQAFPPGEARRALLAAAGKALCDSKRRRDGKSQAVAASMNHRAPCPLLNAEGCCVLYDARPMTCRVFGIPMTSAGTSYICPKSGFISGRHYPAADLDVLRSRLVALSRELAEHTQSSKAEAEVLAPVAAVLSTAYDARYFVVGPCKA